MSELEDKYFPAEGSSAPEEPAEDVSEQDWQEWADSYEAAIAGQEQFAEQEWEPGPADYPELDRSALSPEGNAYADQVMLEAGQLANQQAYEQGLYARVEGLAGEFNLGDAALQAVAAEVDEAMRGQFNAWLGQGADPAQAMAALQDADIDGAIRQALVYQRHLKNTENTSLGDWRRGREAAAEKRAREGLSPLPDNAMNAPYIATLARRLGAHAARQAEWQQGVDAAYRRQTGQ